MRDGGEGFVEYVNDAGDMTVVTMVRDVGWVIEKVVSRI